MNKLKSSFVQPGRIWEWPVTRAINYLDDDSKFVWLHTSGSLSKSLAVPTESSFEIFCGINPIKCAFWLLIRKVTNKRRMQSDTGNVNIEDEVLDSEGDVSLNGFHQVTQTWWIAFDTNISISLERNSRIPNWKSRWQLGEQYAGWEHAWWECFCKFTRRWGRRTWNDWIRKMFW